MSAISKAYVGARIHDGQALYIDHALCVQDDGGITVPPKDAVPAGCPVEQLTGGLIAPGFVDLQVNGGGGIMFNDSQCIETLSTIAQAHASIGTTAFLPTLITDKPERTRSAIDAVEQAIAEKVAGIIGIHLEGPHLSVARKGAHDPQLIRPMTDDDLAVALNAAERIPNVMMTVAPENATNEQIRAMADAGIIVSIGHTDADFDTCIAVFDAGARCVTHLFNAMSQFGNREPGLVGAALRQSDVYAGLIADGIHVHPATIQIALAAKPDDEKIFLVTDSMATAGSQIDKFMLNDRQVLRENQRLTLEDGTLAGADLDMPTALSVMTGVVGDDMVRAVARATSGPAGLLRAPQQAGGFKGTSPSVIYMQDDFTKPRIISC